MIFIETTLFTKLLHTHLSDEEYQEFQCFLIENPDVGDVIQGTGGLRKVRWAASNKGKRGGSKDYLLLAKDSTSDLFDDTLC